MLILKVSRWDEFQHYRLRRPPWIRYYTRLLEDPHYRGLPAEARCVLHDVWLLTARDGNARGELRAELADLAFALRLDASNVLACCQQLASIKDTEGNHKWLVLTCTANELRDFASTMLATRKQDAIPETETETETETEPPKPPAPPPELELTPPTGKGTALTRREPWHAQALRLRERLNGRREDEQAAGKLVLSYFNASMGTNYRWGSKVETRIIARLRECRSASMLFYTVDGAMKDDVIMGRKHDSPPNGYKRVSTVFRDAEQIDRFVALSKYRDGQVHPILAEFLAAESPPA